MPQSQLVGDSLGGGGGAAYNAQPPSSARARTRARRPSDLQLALRASPVSAGPTSHSPVSAGPTSHSPVTAGPTSHTVTTTTNRSIPAIGPIPEHATADAWAGDGRRTSSFLVINESTVDLRHTVCSKAQVAKGTRVFSYIGARGPAGGAGPLPAPTASRAVCRRRRSPSAAPRKSS